jgi:hypothetical protein
MRYRAESSQRPHRPRLHVCCPFVMAGDYVARRCVVPFAEESAIEKTPLTLERATERGDWRDWRHASEIKSVHPVPPSAI